MPIKDAAKIFTSHYLNQFALGDFQRLVDVADEYLPEATPDTCFGDIFTAIYQLLSREYRWEYYYKNVLANRILLGRHSPNTTTMLSEFRVGQSKADCVILNGAATCYEIKTAFDSLNRLPEQLADYEKLFDYVNVVTCKQHVDKVLEQVKPHIGVLVLNAKSSISTHRAAQRIEGQDIDIPFMVKSLRQQEAAEIYCGLEGSMPNVGSTQLQSVFIQRFLEADPQRLRTLFRETLKKSRKNHHYLLQSLPTCLVNAAISYKLSDKTLGHLMTHLSYQYQRNANVLPSA